LFSSSVFPPPSSFKHYYPLPVLPKATDFNLILSSLSLSLSSFPSSTQLIHKDLLSIFSLLLSNELFDLKSEKNTSALHSLLIASKNPSSKIESFYKKKSTKNKSSFSYGYILKKLGIVQLLMKILRYLSL
jgi:hypothetical protein